MKNMKKSKFSQKYLVVTSYQVILLKTGSIKIKFLKIASVKMFVCMHIYLHTYKHTNT